MGRKPKQIVELPAVYAAMSNSELLDEFSAIMQNCDCCASSRSEAQQQAWERDAVDAALRARLAGWLNDSINTPAPGKRITVRLADLDALYCRVDDVNQLPLEQIDLIGEDGCSIALSPEMLEEWRFIGLTNKEFFKMRFWEHAGNCPKES